jgi:hypothetical protein
LLHKAQRGKFWQVGALTWRHIPKDSTFHSHRWEHLRSNTRILELAHKVDCGISQGGRLFAVMERL